MQRCGLEWFFRLMQEPRRLWRRYLVDDLAFVYYVVLELARGKARQLRALTMSGTDDAVGDKDR
jgi:N-acetylglucosaminyldiphosphoundecaprenol N-acetyl-beta-D-mannosaminyltransferase